jgi:hypothetical protein
MLVTPELNLNGQYSKTEFKAYTHRNAANLTHLDIAHINDGLIFTYETHYAFPNEKINKLALKTELSLKVPTRMRTNTIHMETYTLAGKMLAQI